MNRTKRLNQSNRRKGGSVMKVKMNLVDIDFCLSIVSVLIERKLKAGVERVTNQTLIRELEISKQLMNHHLTAENHKREKLLSVMGVEREKVGKTVFWSLDIGKFSRFLKKYSNVETMKITFSEN